MPGDEQVGPLRIIGARWTKRVNQLRIRCVPCKREFEHPANRWMVSCPWCGLGVKLAAIRSYGMAERIDAKGGS